MGEEMFNTNPDFIDVDKDCRVLGIVQINQTLALNVTPMTAAKEGENVIPTPNWLRNHPAYEGGWRTIQYFRSTNGSYQIYIHKDHGRIRSQKQVIQILDYLLSMQENAQKLVHMDAQDNDANNLAQGTSVVGPTLDSEAKHGEVNTQSHPREPKRRLDSSESHPPYSRQLDSGKDKSTRTRSSNKQDLSRSYTRRGYKPGMSLIAEDELEKAGLACQQLHKWYMNQTDGKKTISPVALGLKYLEKHLLNGVGYISLRYEDLFDLFTFSAIDVGLLTCFLLHMIQEMREMVGSERPRVSIIDPQRFTLRPDTKRDIIENENSIVEHISKILSHYKDNRDFYAFPYNTTWHWILIVTVPKLGEVWYLDYANTSVESLKSIKSVITRAFNMHLRHIRKPKERKLHHYLNFKCHKQPSGSQHCGFYVCHHLKELINYKGQPEDFQLPGVDNISQDTLYGIRERIVAFLLSQVLCKEGEFYNPLI